VWTWADGDGLNLEGFNGAIGWTQPSVVLGGKFPDQLDPSSLPRNVLIKYAAAVSSTVTNGAANCFYADTVVWNASTDQNFSYGYRYVRGGTLTPARPEFAPYVGANAGVTANYGFGGYNKNTVPFSAWDTETNPPTRLAVGFIENNVATGLVDGRYWSYPNGAGILNSSGNGREWFLIFNTPYTNDVPNNAYKIAILLNPLPIMYTGTVTRRNGINQTAGDEFMIFANHINTLNDVFTFTPSAPSAVNTKGSVPYSYNVSQNYPNPFNPSTTIQYELKSSGHVTITIYNILGQLVRVLVNEVRNEGPQIVLWDGRDGNHHQASSGVYFYRVEISDQKNGVRIFNDVKKMVLLK
jgi:hypothetical protein